MSSSGLLLILLSLFVSIDAISVVVNETVGGQAILKCHTSQRTAVDWWYQRTDGDNTRQICLNGEVVVEMRSRFSICSQNTGDYDLVIADVDLTDSGLYTCVEDAGLGQRTTILLTVTAAAVVDLNQSKTASLRTSDVNNSAEYHEGTGVHVAVVVVPVVIIFAVLVTALVVVILRFVCRKELIKIAGRFPVVQRLLLKCLRYEESTERNAGEAESLKTPARQSSVETETIGTVMTPPEEKPSQETQTSPWMASSGNDSQAPATSQSQELPSRPVTRLQQNDEPLCAAGFHDGPTPKAIPDAKAWKGKEARQKAKANDAAAVADKENQEQRAPTGLSKKPGSLACHSAPKSLDVHVPAADRTIRSAFGVQTQNKILA